MNDGLCEIVNLLGAMWRGPSNAGQRSDGKICTAQGGECRDNHKFYTLRMRDAKSWQSPIADDTCPARCGYLREESRDIPREQREQFVRGMIGLDGAPSTALEYDEDHVQVDGLVLE